MGFKNDQIGTPGNGGLGGNGGNAIAKCAFA